MTNIVLVRPSIPYNKTYFGRTVFPPLNLLMLAACASRSHNVKIIDEIVERIVIPDDTDLVGITIPTTAYALRAYEIADECRRMGEYVVLGGMHASVLPEEALLHADTVVCGEAESIWPRLIEDFSHGVTQNTYRMSQQNSLVGLPSPRRDLVNPKKYIFPNLIQATRGCNRHCIYCSISSFNDRKHRCRPLDEVIEEIRPFSGTFVPIIDDNLFGNLDYAKNLMRSLIPLHIRWASQIPIEYFADKEILELAVRSGCKHILAGLESSSSQSLIEAGRKRFDTDVLKKIFRDLGENGITSWVHFIFGFDSDTPEVFENTCEYARELGIPIVVFHILTPYPGTPLFAQMEEQRRLLTKNWLLYDGKHAVFRPNNMSSEQLRDGFIRAWKAFYGFHSIYSRLMMNKQFRGSTLMINLGGRRLARYMAEG